jgi:hypothetical protein
VKYWTSAEDLAGKVALTWPTFLRRYPAIGWIRANEATSRESLAALAKAQAEIGDLKSQLDTARTTAPPGTETLAQGGETFSLPVYAKGYWQKDGVGYRHAAGRWTPVEMTWDRAFGYMGLRMMQESDEPTLEDDLCNVALFDNYEKVEVAFVEAACEAAKDQRVNTTISRSFEGVEAHDEDFQTILLQFDALGLIQRSQRNRSVKDTSNYWSLTPYGHTYLVRLRALQSGEGSLARPTDKGPPVSKLRDNHDSGSANAATD